MIEFLARRVYEGKLRFETVPERFKEAVLEILQSKYGFILTDTPMTADAQTDETDDDGLGQDTI